MSSRVVIGKEYAFRTRNRDEFFLCGTVSEVLDAGRTARVQLTAPSRGLEFLAVPGEGVALQLYLPSLRVGTPAAWHEAERLRLLEAQEQSAAASSS